MKTVIKMRWLILILWLAAAVGLFLAAPNMEELVRDKGQISVPDGYSSSTAAELVKEMKGDTSGAANTQSSVLVFHNEKGITATDLEEIKRGVEKLKDGEKTYGITEVITHLDTKDLEEQMVSKDGKTVLVLVTSSMDGRTPAEARDALYEVLDGVSVEHYYTGDWLIGEDVVQSSQEGLKKTEYITVIFILAILFIVFRSAVAPFIPLVTVGVSYLVAQSVVGFLVEWVNFPLSNFTQIFMVAVMFGIGTDYCILLISRFKEELAQGEDRTSAILNTYRTAGKTVFYSGLAVLVGFASIGLSTFSLYRSAVAVGVGVAVLLIALVTLVPFFMATMGKAIFWPSKGSLEHKPSRLWGAVGNFSLKRPVWALVILAVILVPFLAAYQGATSYNSLEEIGDKYNSVKAFNVITDSFGPGDSMPSKIVVKVAQPLDTAEGMAAVERVTRELDEVEGVKTVRSATRPSGDPLEDLQVAEQVKQLGDGLDEGADGLGQINAGLTEAGTKLKENQPKLAEAVQGAGQLVDGTIAMKQNIVKMGDGLKQIEKGLQDGSMGAAQISAGLQTAKASAEQLKAGSDALLAGYKELQGNFGKIAGGYAQVQQNVSSLTAGLAGVGQGLDGLAQKYPELGNDPLYQQLRTSVTDLEAGSKDLGNGIGELNQGLTAAMGGFQQANDGFAEAIAGQQALSDGLQQLSNALVGLQAGIDKLAGGQGQIVANVPAFTGGFDQITAGQKELQKGYADMNSQMGQLTDGLTQSTDGLTQVTDGLKEANGYLSDLSAGPDKQLTGWYLPQEALENEDFQKALDAYMSEDRKIATFDVVFAGNPYEIETLERVADLNAAVERALKDTDYAGATYAVEGVSSINNDLRNISAEDYSRTVMLMLIGIGLILILMFRSIVMPIYIILSLLITYYSSLAIAEVIFVRILGYTGISWAVPFFGFVMLMALGVDYSIFLMDRFKEYRHLPPREGILLAMKHMGSVIISAAVILGGTFAAMLPSGVMSLLQIATILLCGLFLYALLMLPLFMPVMVRVFDKANWWPFMGEPKRKEEAKPVTTTVEAQ